MANIAFLSEGGVDHATIRNFLRNGHRVTVYNRTLEKAQALQAEIPIVACTPREAVAGADAVFSMHDSELINTLRIAHGRAPSK